MNNITYFLIVHNIVSLKNYLNFIKNKISFNNINYVYICGVAPEKTDIYNQREFNIRSSYDNSIYSKNNSLLRQHSTYMYILENLDDVKTDYISIEGCTTIRLERDKYKSLNEHTLYTTIRKSDCLNNYNNEKYNSYYKKVFGYDLNDGNYFYLFDYLIFHKNISNYIYAMLKNNILKLLNNIPEPGIYLPEYFDFCIFQDFLSNYKNKFDSSQLGFSFKTFNRNIKGLHVYN